MADSNVIDLMTTRIRYACGPLARWWQTSRSVGRFDPDALCLALEPLKAIEAAPGPTGEAIRYLIAGAPDLDLDRITNAIALLCAVAGGEPVALVGASPIIRHEQLSLPGIEPPRPRPQRGTRS